MTKEIKKDEKRKIFMTIGEQSDIGKTYIVNGLTYMLEKNGQQVAKFDGDYMANSEKNKGYYIQYRLPNNDNPVESCVPFDLLKAKDVVGKTTDTGVQNIIIDLPVKALVPLQETYDEDMIDLFYNSFADKGYELNLIVPIVVDKDIDNTLQLLSRTFKTIELDSKINIITVLNVGLMKANNELGNIEKYEEFMNYNVFNKNVNIIEVRITTRFDDKGVIAEQLAHTKFETFLNTKQNGHISPLVGGIRKDFERLYQALN